MRVTPSKRIVVGLNKEGKSTAVEIASTPLHELDPVGESIDETTWGADVALLAHHTERAFGSADREEWAVEPLPAGAVFRLVNFPAHSKVDLHTTDTIDVGVVLSGEMHGWENRSDYPCKKFAVLVSTNRPEEW